MVPGGRVKVDDFAGFLEKAQDVVVHEGGGAIKDERACAPGRLSRIYERNLILQKILNHLINTQDTIVAELSTALFQDPFLPIRVA